MAKEVDFKRFMKIQDRQLTWRHWIYQEICILLILAWVILKYRVEIIGKENQPKGFQSYIVACNHVSALDPPLVSIALNYQPISFLAKLELFQGFWLRTYSWLMSSIAVNREKLDLSTVKSALKVLKHGKWALGVFPEGTRVKDGKASEPKRGVAYFAKTANVPVLPLGIHLWTPPKGGRKRIEVRIGHLIPPEGSMDELGTRVQEAIEALANPVEP